MSEEKGCTNCSDKSDVHVLTWNPKEWLELTDAVIDAHITALDFGSSIRMKWSVGARKQGIGVGSTVFLLRQNSDRGIIARGEVVGEIFQAPHWNESGSDTNYIEFKLTGMKKINERIQTERLLVEINCESEELWNQIYGSGRTLCEVDGINLCALWDSH